MQHDNQDAEPLVSERTLNHPDNLLDINYFPYGDYLEENDLVAPLSPSSSSDNSSCLSQTSDDCFDSLLGQDLEYDKARGCKFSVAPLLMPDNVVLQPSGIFGFFSSILHFVSVHLPGSAIVPLFFIHFPLKPLL